MEEKDIKKELEILESSNLMYENTKKHARTEMKRVLNEDGSRKFSDEQIQNKIDLIEEAQKELYQKYEAFGGNVEELKERTMKGDLNKKTKKSSKKAKVIENITPQEITPKKPKEVKPLVAPEQAKLKDEFLPVSNINNNSSYDVIPLPSRGECYPNKMATIPVGYLTAYDENLIVAPNLYKEGQVFD